jgi:ferredoxin
MCPVPQKAIELVEAAVTTQRGEKYTVRCPIVITDICIGCGRCEYYCPVNGEAAIRVYAPTWESAPDIRN